MLLNQNYEPSTCHNPRLMKLTIQMMQEQLQIICLMLQIVIKIIKQDSLPPFVLF